MITFKQFLFEGGNVQIDGEEADRIDLSKHDRTEITGKIGAALKAINAAFKKDTGKPIWSDALMKSQKYLSGSAFHFFSKDIDDATFKKHKGSVGDIDTQVDKDLEGELKEFLTKHKGETFGPVTLIGFKTSAGTHITLWKLKDAGINIQIDMELVEYDKDEPTEWSNFSHSSAWEDMTKGVKGVAHKYLMRALESPKLKDVVIKAKTARGKDKETKSSTTAFSVTHGVRKKLKPVLDDNGKQVMVNGKPAYHELSTTESKGTTNLSEIFETYFGRKPSKEDLKDMSSFTGLLKLVKKTFSKPDQQKVADGFAHTLWSKAAQGLYRDDPEKDKAEKDQMMGVLLKELSLKDTYGAMRKEFYENYR